MKDENKIVILTTKTNSSLRDSLLREKKYLAFKNMLTSYCENNNIKYIILPLEKIFQAIDIGSIFIILSYYGLYKTYPIVRQSLKDKMKNKKLISVIGLEKYQTIEDFSFYFVLCPKVKKNTSFIFFESITKKDEVIKKENLFKIGIDKEENIQKLFPEYEEIKKNSKDQKFSITKISPDLNEDFSIILFTEKPEDFLLIQDLRVRGIKVATSFSCSVYEKIKFGIFDKVSDISKLNNIINEKVNNLEIKNNSHSFFLLLKQNQ